MKKFFLIISLSILIQACTNSEEHKILEQYHQAEKARNLPQMIISLSSLSSINKNKYQQKLTNALNAQQLLKQADTEFTNNKLASAFLYSSDSYQLVPSAQAKHILLASGKKLLPLLQVDKEINKAYAYLTDTTFNEISKIANEDVKQWNLIHLNSHLSSLSSASTILKRSIKRVNDTDSLSSTEQFKSLSANLLLALSEINNVIAFFNQKSLSYSAKKLNKISQLLTEETANILAYVRPSLAYNAILPKFIEAQKEYSQYQEIFDNIAASSHSDNTSTYKEWKKIELITLNINSNEALAEYPNHRKKYQTIFKSTLELDSQLSFHFQPSIFTNNVFDQETQKIITRLNEFKQIIYYG